MISPELLRRYVFFRNLQEPQLKAIAMLSDEVTVAQGETLFEIDQNANTLYLLLEGRIDLKYLVVDRDDPSNRQVYDVGEINPGEAFGISALIEPYRYTSSASAGQESRVLKIDAKALRAYCTGQPEVGLLLLQHVAQTAMARLHDTRIQLAARQN